MKRAVLIAFCMLFGAGIAFAQVPGSIGVYADIEGTNCNLTATGGLLDIYTLHLNTDGATASNFAIEYPVGITFIADAVPVLGDPFLYIGASINGVSVAYGSCMSGTFAIMKSSTVGLPAACSLVSVVAHPDIGLIEGVDCQSFRFDPPPTGGQARINSDGSCDCNVPVHDSTWGGVKALYQ